MKALFFLGRMVFGGFFLYNAIHHFKETKGLAAYAGYKGVPNPDQAVLISGALLAVGATSVLLGVKPKIGTHALVSFLAAVSPAVHDFWNIPEQGEHMNQMINFSKNMALLGAALLLMGVPEPWPASLG